MASETKDKDKPAAALKVSAYNSCQRGRYESAKAHADESEFSLAWESEALCLKKNKAAGADEAAVVRLPWQHVTGIWVSLRNRAGAGFGLEVTFETSHPACGSDFLQVVAAMDGAAGDFLTFLQSEQAGRLKDGRAPKFATSRWASTLYSNGFSVRGLRLFLGRLSILFEVLYALCFFAQLEGLIMSKEAKLTQALSVLFQDLQEMHSDLTQSLPAMMAEYRWWDAFFKFGFSLPAMVFMSLWRVTRHTSSWLMFLMLLQHLMAVFFMFDALWRTLRGALKSAMTFHKAATKVNKAIKKSRTADM